MKALGTHKEKKLTAAGVRALITPGRYGDGNGLYLVVEKSGSKHWVQRLVVNGRRRDIGLGSFTVVGLADARARAFEYRRIARTGGDPLIAHRRNAVSVPTFEQAAREVYDSQKSTWKNTKHAAQWLTTIETYAVPAIGQWRIDNIQTPDILQVLSPIWLRRPETARRVRQRLKIIFDWAIAAGHRSGENPVNGAVRGLPKQPENKRHHKALPYKEISRFIEKLRASPATPTVLLAFEFLILCAARTGEVLGAHWDEIDFGSGIWTIPASRMKAGVEHRVPLSARALEILRAVEKLHHGSEIIFPGRNPKKPLSNMAFLKTIERMQLDITAHGFRSTFRDWVSEETPFSSDLAEMALAHTIRNKVEAAYRRGDLLEKRRELMDAWARVCVPR